MGKGGETVSLRKSRPGEEGWYCIEGADWPFGEQRRKYNGERRLFVDIIKHRSGVETSLRTKRTEEVEEEG